MSFRQLIAGGNKNIEVLAAVNRVVIDGYTDMVRCQCEMLSDLFDDIRAYGSGTDELSIQFKESLATIREDLATLQSMAKFRPG